MVNQIKNRIFFLLKFSFFLSVVSIVILSCASAAQSTSGYTSYESYAVKEGETVKSIAADYGISESVIYNLNPESRNGLRANSILILPATSKKSSSTKKDRLFIEHEVQKQETLYGLSKKYEISEEDIKKYNEQLNLRDLQIGEIILIPKPIDKGIKSPALELPPGIEEYEIVGKDTKYSISKKFGITIEELEALNPKMDETLEIGYKILVPSEKPKKGEELDTENFEYYEVQSKEGFYRLEKKFGLSEKEIIKLNPQAKDGLQEGMILKLPKPGLNKEAKEISVENLESSIRYKEMKHLALMLPFGLNELDSVNHQDVVKNDVTLRISLDFYSGALIAAEFAKEQGISVTLDVYDTEKDENKVVSIISDENFDKTDAIIGPLLQRNIAKAATLLEKDNIPIFSPLSNREIAKLPNLFQTLPTSATLENLIIQYIKQHSINKNIILIVDSKHQQQRQKIIKEIPGMEIISVSGNYVERDEISEILSEDLDNWVILISDRPILVSSTVNILGDLANSHSIRLFSLDKNDAFDWEEVSNSRLAKLNFTFPSVNKSYKSSENSFISKYKEKHGVVPNRYAIRGFDITYDVILRMASEKNIYDAFDAKVETIYTENKFRYTHNNRDGYVNQAAFILKYTDDLTFEEVE